MTDGGYTQTEAWNLQLQAKVTRLERELSDCTLAREQLAAEVERLRGNETLAEYAAKAACYDDMKKRATAAEAALAEARAEVERLHAEIQKWKTAAGVQNFGLKVANEDCDTLEQRATKAEAALAEAVKERDELAARNACWRALFDAHDIEEETLHTRTQALLNVVRAAEDVERIEREGKRTDADHHAIDRLCNKFRALKDSQC